MLKEEEGRGSLEELTVWIREEKEECSTWRRCGKGRCRAEGREGKGEESVSSDHRTKRGGQRFLSSTYGFTDQSFVI